MARMNLAPRLLEGDHVRLEPVGEGHREALRAALDCDPETWAIYSRSGYGPAFDGFFDDMVGPRPDRIAFAVRDKASGRVAGTSSFIRPESAHGTVEIGYTFFHPDFRGTAVNPEAKLLMLGAAFGAGALRVAFHVDTRNARSQAAVRKLGATKEGVLRRHIVTWTGHRRDTAVFSIIEEEWGEVREQLRRRLREQHAP